MSLDRFYAALYGADKAMMELARINDMGLLFRLAAKLKDADIATAVVDDQLFAVEGNESAVSFLVMADEDNFMRARLILEEIREKGGGEWPALTKDSLLGGRIKIWQPAKGYRAAIDPALLAAAIDARPSHKALDAGTGMGAAALCVAARAPGVCIEGIEIDGFLADLANYNALANGFARRVNFIQGDILDKNLPLEPASFDHVMANPPYRKAGAGNASPDAIKTASTVEGGASLGDWVDFCVKMARPKGFVTIIHHASRLDEMLNCMRGRLGDMVVFPLWPGRAGKPAKRIIVRGRKGAKGLLRLAKGLALHDDDGNYTQEAAAILRHGEPLVM